jgi:DeoR/GlpR family transcriptional regulator of sugar metabolism
MFGNKEEKVRRLQEEQALLEQHGELSPAELAQMLQVPRSTVLRDLPLLEEQGVFLQENERGLLSLFRKK